MANDVHIIHPDRPEEQTGGFAQSESGLIIPTELAQKRVRWLDDVLKVLRRFQKTMDNERVDTFLICRDCQTAIAFELNTENGETAATCKCKRRVLG